MTRKEFFRRVYSVDTEAGDRLQYILTKAEVCPDYARSINYTRVMPYRFRASRVLSGSFVWMYTQEGQWYWRVIFDMLDEPEV